MSPPRVAAAAAAAKPPAPPAPNAPLRAVLSLRYALDALDTADKALRQEIESRQAAEAPAADLVRTRRKTRLLEKARRLSEEAADCVARALEEEP